MILDVVLGHTIDTKMWINNLQKNGSEHIIVIDYEYREAIKEIEGILYMSPTNAMKYIEKFDTKNYYLSLYAFPGMQGTMSSLYRKKY